MDELINTLDIEHVDNILKDQHIPKKTDMVAIRNKLNQLVIKEKLVVSDFMAAYLYIGDIDYRCSSLTDRTTMFVLAFNPSQQVGRIAKELMQFCESNHKCLSEYIVVEDVPWDPLLLRLKVDFTTIMYVKYCPKLVLERITAIDKISNFKIVNKLYLLGQMFNIFSNFTFESVDYITYITRELLNVSNEKTVSVLATAYTIAMIIYRQSKLPSIEIKKQNNIPELPDIMKVYQQLLKKYPSSILTGQHAVNVLTGNIYIGEPLMVYSNTYEEYSNAFFKELDELNPTMERRSMYGVDLIPAMTIIRINNNPIVLILDSDQYTITGFSDSDMNYSGYGSTLSLYSRLAILNGSHFRPISSDKQSLPDSDTSNVYQSLLDIDHCKMMINILVKHTLPKYRIIDTNCPQKCVDVEMNEQENKHWGDQRNFYYRYNPFTSKGNNIPSLYFDAESYTGLIIP